MKKDKKALELLYEEISSFIFLEEEEQFAEIAAKGMIEKIEQIISKIEFPSKVTRLSILLRDSNVNPSCKIDFFPSYQFIKMLNIDKEQMDNFIRTFCVVIDECLNSILLKKEGDKQLILFPRPFPEDLRKAQSYIKKDFQNKKEVIKELENTLKIYIQTIIEHFTLSNNLLLGNGVKQYLSWRKEKVKFAKLKNKLPELKGIF